MRIAVCLITFMRPKGLRAALESLAGQVFAGEAPDVRVVVVDNDEAASARPVVDELRAGGYRWPLAYAVEARRGIPFARNRCVAIARPDADWICFIDDDEEAAPGWLAELMRVQREYQADIVTGPVVSRYEGELPDWASRSGILQRLRFPTGHRRDRAYTNNVMFRAEVFDAVQPHFDERLAMAGGSDTHFSRRADRAGFSIVYADDAEVFERLPASRMTRRWLFQRAYRVGTTNGFVARDISDSLGEAVRSVGPKALSQLARGTAYAALGLVAGHHRSVRGIRLVASGAGIVVGLLGGRYDEYRRTHGS